jgi:two-component system, OmpR family, response regulator VicR
MAEPQPEQPLILVVEDDAELAATLRSGLNAAGYRVRIAASGADARTQLAELEPELILLDLMLPNTDGLVLLGTVKALRFAPVIVLSARNKQTDHVLALRLGADDFVTRPFDMEELLARVEVLLRRSTPEPTGVERATDRITVGNLTIFHARRLVTVGAEPIHLTPTEYRILHSLATHVDEIVSREALVQLVWGYTGVGPGQLIDTHLWRLRRKLRDSALSAPRIMTIHGVGFGLMSGESSHREPDAPAT